MHNSSVLSNCFWSKKSYDTDDKSRCSFSVILTLPNLKICRMNEYQPENIENKLFISTSIKTIYMNETVSTSFLLFLLSSMPNLCNLRVYLLTWKEDFSFTENNFIHNKLSIIEMVRCSSVSSLHIYIPLATIQDTDRSFLFNYTLMKNLFSHIANFNINFTLYISSDEIAAEICTQLKLCP